MELIATLLLLLIGAAVYFLPTIIAISRSSAAMTGVTLLNLLLGWTVIGWVVALVWSFSSESETDANNRRLANARIAEGYNPSTRKD
jgi:putative effector of murein hydrolase LrgA (UPF0299 family)